jgi:hypothetical protein
MTEVTIGDSPQKPQDFDAEPQRHRVFILFLCASVALRQGFWGGDPEWTGF